ncbi:DUF2931 family protein [uncultured Flavobacterium sp.]|uniref:DUF2931 family protein n=1 Tax=uncultured Flavobacterium sp. TaxID=165435 RepID=UPI0030EEEF4F|tara:strand:- start:70122 stop:71213 length:1092 start_codon:yes stop_codon:yes gene_type:complete
MKNLLFILLITQLSACQNKQTQQQNMETTQTEKFAWNPTFTCPDGYPVEVYSGGFAEPYQSLHLGVGTAGWGETGGSMSESKQIPQGLQVTWLAFAEDCFYTIKCEIDHKKIEQLFQEGFEMRGASGKLKHEDYYYIIAGFAPGGVVVVWMAGAAKTTEVGRYQGEKIEIKEPPGLDSHERLYFDAVYRKGVMENEKIVPLEVQQTNKNKPIPYGLWDSYRVKYVWKPTFVIQNDGKMNERVTLDLLNGERYSIRDFNFPIRTDYKDNYNLKIEYTKQAIPKSVGFSWYDKEGQLYSGKVEFDENEIFEAFTILYKDNKDTEAELEFKVNMTNTFITVKLKGNGKEIAITKSQQKVFESDNKW